DALELVAGLRAGGAEEPLVVLGTQGEEELAALCYEVGADAYLCVPSTTTRSLLWTLARATERQRLIREVRRLAQADRQRLQQEHGEAERLLAEQRDLIRDLAQQQPEPEVGETVELPAALKSHYRELLRAHVIMGAGHLVGEMGTLADLL